jgi:hypothetical protein
MPRPVVQTGPEEVAAAMRIKERADQLGYDVESYWMLLQTDAEEWEVMGHEAIVLIESFQRSIAETN